MGGSAVRARTRARAEKRKAAKESVTPAKPISAVFRPTMPTWLLTAIILVAVVLAYQQAWTAGYIWDDDMYVTKNPLLTAADGLWRIWFSFDAPSQYFPLTYTTFRLEHALWEFNSAGYHWTNILLHCANALLVWRLLRVLNVPGAWFAAALFALHPVQVESVAWVTERKNVLMGFFFLISLLAWVGFLEDKGSRSRWSFALSLIAYVLALAAKTTACTLPAALLLILWWRRERITVQRWLQIAPFVLIGIGAGIVSILWERVHGADNTGFVAVGLVERGLIASRAIWFYLSKLAWPNELIFSYPRWDISRTHATDYFWPLALIALIAALVSGRRRFGRGPEVAFGFFVLTLSPLLGMVLVTTFLYSFVADHYQYVACIGPLALFAAVCDAGAARLFGSSRERWTPAPGAVLLGILAVMTWRQAGIYKNEETLWNHTIAHNPNSWMARNNLGGYLTKEKRFDAAIEQYRKIVELRPEDSLGHFNLGAALARKGDFEAAVAEDERALALQPNEARAERNLAQALMSLGRFDEAITHFRRAIELRATRKDATGQIPELELELGNALLKKGESAEAVEHYRRALELRPGYAAAHINLANALLQQGVTEEARQHLEEAKRLDPNAVSGAEAYVEAGNAALQKRDLDAAIANYRQALTIRSNYPEAHSNLGTALLLEGKLADAISEFEATLALAPQSVPTLNSLARLLATAPDERLRNADRAAQLAEHAVDLSQRRDPASFRALAFALAEKGEFEPAAEAADEAVKLAESTSPAFAEVVRRERDVYRNREKPLSH